MTIVRGVGLLSVALEWIVEKKAKLQKWRALLEDSSSILTFGVAPLSGFGAMVLSPLAQFKL